MQQSIPAAAKQMTRLISYTQVILTSCFVDLSTLLVTTPAFEKLHTKSTLFLSVILFDQRPVTTFSKR